MALCKFPYSTKVSVIYTGIENTVSSLWVLCQWCEDNIGMINHDWQYELLNEDVYQIFSQLDVRFWFTNEEDYVRFMLTYGT